MLESTIVRLKETAFTIPVPKSTDPRNGYWTVKCIVVDVDDTEILFRATCKDWLDHKFNLPTPKRLDTLFECMFLTLCELIIYLRIEYLCTL